MKARHMASNRTLALMGLLMPLLGTAGTLDVYEQFTGKTILMPSGLSSVPDSIVSELPPEKTNAIAKIENELSKMGIAVVNDGPHFVRIFPSRDQDILTNVPLRGAKLGLSSGQTASPVGTINFINCDLNMVLEIYAGMSQRTILRPGVLASTVVSLKSHSPLTRDEVAYALETVFAMNGIWIVKDGDKFVQVLPMAQRPFATARAPKPEANEKLIDPKKLPSIGVSERPRPMTPIERDLERCQKAFYEFIHYKGPRDSAAQRLLELYANSTGKTAEPSKDFEGVRIRFHVDTPLTKSELLYAIETTFSLNNIEIIEADGGRIRLGHKDRAVRPSATDLVIPGKDVGWKGNHVLHVTKRNGNSLEGVRIVTSSAGTTRTVTADRGTVSQGLEPNSVKLTLYNVRFEDGKQNGTAQEMTMELVR